ncbi:MAG: diacylglycerol kinase [Burkholderiales bacterium]|nr:diacylglycerol kinase [Burkholderiales bacterium]
MPRTPPREPPSEPPEPPGPRDRPTSAFKSRGGLSRIAAAARYSAAGLQSAIRHEAAFRQELAIGIPMLVATPWLAPGRWQAAAMAASILFVFVVELLNSAIEAIADALSVDHHPLLGRAKDLGSAAVMVSLVTVVMVWAIALWA